MPEAATVDPRKALRSTITFLSIPAVFLGVILITGIQLPGAVLYGFAAILGVALFVRSFSDPEWLLAAAILYMPLSKFIVGSIAPGINGINMIIGMLMVAWLTEASRYRRPLWRKVPTGGIVGAWAAISCFSGITAAIMIGPDFLRDQVLEFKAWVDQFIFFFAFLNLIRDGAMAKRLVVYMMLGYLLVMVLGVVEMREKSGLSTIEKSRVLGPQLQPNDFGAFLVYTIAPLLAYFLHHIYQLRAWLLTPLFLLVVKLLLVTFSRGAYIGLGLAGVAAGYVRGKLFLATSGLLAVGLLVAFPQLIPGSLQDRMSQTTSDDYGGEAELDRSSQTRVILWKAGLDMTLDYPLLGTGFKGFIVLKDQYTEMPVRESDNHNMYLFISSQMGIPALLIFLLLFYRMYAMGAALYRTSDDPHTRIIGLGGAVMVAGVFGVNMFGSRMVGIEVNGNFWVYLAIMGHLWAEQQRRLTPAAAARSGSR